MTRSPERSGDLLCNFEYGVAPPSAECGDLFNRYAAVSINSPHMDGGKSPSFRRHRVTPARVCPSPFRYTNLLRGVGGGVFELDS